MAVAVVFLRGVNVGAHRRVTMADLRGALTDAGYDDVTTYLQSGNLVLDRGGTSATELTRSVEAALRAGLGLDIDVIVRTGAQLTKVVAANPFLGQRVDRSALHCGFLQSRPAAAAARALDGVSFGPDAFERRGTELYLWYPNGLGRSKMTPASFERTLGVPMTVRKWSVVTAVLDLAVAAGRRRPTR